MFLLCFYLRRPCKLATTSKSLSSLCLATRLAKTYDETRSTGIARHHKHNFDQNAFKTLSLCNQRHAFVCIIAHNLAENSNRFLVLSTMLIRLRFTCKFLKKFNRCSNEQEETIDVSGGRGNDWRVCFLLKLDLCEMILANRTNL